MNRSSRRFEHVPLEQVPVLDERPRILHVSPNHTDARRQALERAGFRVEVAQAAGEAARRLREEPFDAVIVGHPLSREEKAAVVGAARAAESAPWIIALYKLWVTEGSGAHVAIDAQDGPEAVISALRRLGRGRGGRRKRK